MNDYSEPFFFIFSNLVIAIFAIALGEIIAFANTEDNTTNEA